MVYEKVCQLISYQLGIDEDKISATSDIFEDLGADSLDVFGLTIEDDQVQDFHTVGDMVSFIESNT